MAIRAFVTDWSDVQHKQRHTDAAKMNQNSSMKAYFSGAAAAGIITQPSRSAQQGVGVDERTLAMAGPAEDVLPPPSARGNVEDPDFEVTIAALPEVVEQARALAQRLEELRLHADAARVRAVWRDLEHRGQRSRDNYIPPHLVPTTPGLRPQAGSSVRGPGVTPRRCEDQGAMSGRWQTCSQGFHKHPLQLSRQPFEDNDLGVSGMFYPKRRAEQVTKNLEYRIESLNPGR